MAVSVTTGKHLSDLYARITYHKSEQSHVTVLLKSFENEAEDKFLELSLCN